MTSIDLEVLEQMGQEMGKHTCECKFFNFETDSSTLRLG